MENNQRIERLYRKHHYWLLGAAWNICKNQEMAEDIVGDLYLWLGEEVRQKIWKDDGFNLIYLIHFIKSRLMNRLKRDSKMVYKAEICDNTIDIEYDEEKDLEFHKSYDSVLEEINQMEKSNKWVSAKLFKIYWIENPEMTLEGLSKKIGISNSTAFTHIKKMKDHLRITVNNPFND